MSALIVESSSTPYLHDFFLQNFYEMVAQMGYFKASYI